ncbi:MAG: glycosyltransferase N-terminal domain-containing protein [bacterium]
MKFYRFFYNILFVIGFVFTWPYYFRRMWRRGNVAQGFFERFGCYSKELRQKIASMNRPIWIHAVSVGEIKIAQVLIREIRALAPQQPVVISTTTQTGRQVGGKLVDAQTALIYTPIDFFCVTRRAFDLIRPSLLVLVESEIWPNMVWEAENRLVPVCLINARLSERSRRRYRRFSFWMEPILRKLAWIGVQHPDDLPRLADAGFQPHKLFQTGSLKFDVADLGNYDNELAVLLRQKLGWTANDLVLLGGSTHPGEEELLLRTFQNLKKTAPSLKLILAPRHMERAAEVETVCNSWSTVRKSRLNGTGGTSPDVLILDTTGELSSLYPMGDLIFIGKSLLGRGGQNFIEAARFGRPVIVGPHMENFANLAETFKKDGGIVQVANEEELLETMQALLVDEPRREQLSQRAAAIFQQNLGAGKTTARMILATLANVKK